MNDFNPSDELKNTQKSRVLNYLKKNKSIDPYTSWVELGIYRLAAVIHLLRKDNVSIKTERAAVKNKFNEECIVAKYQLNTD